jgi:hypothetical protein
VPELADGRAGEVWREERVQMKLCDAKLVLETKYTRLNRLQRRWKRLRGRASRVSIRVRASVFRSAKKLGRRWFFLYFVILLKILDWENALEIPGDALICHV